MSGRARRAASTAAVLLAVTVAPALRADDPGGEGFALPAGPDWPQARGRLLIQLRAVADDHAPGAVFRQDVPYTRTVLMLAGEGDEAARDVTVEEAARWGQPPDALFAEGLLNLERRLPPRIRTTPELPRGVKVNLFYGEHPFAAAYALAIEGYPRCMGPKGTLLAVPSRHALLCYPVESSRAFHAFLALVNLAADIQTTGENPIVPHVYWLHEGRFETQRVVIEGKRFHSERTPAFEELLKDLPRDIHDPGPRRW